MNNKIIVANWKMNGNIKSIDEFYKIFQKYDNKKHKLIICPPLHLIHYIKNIFNKNKNIEFGAQNCSVKTLNGPFTGEVSCDMLKEIGCDFVLIGHTERRILFNETMHEVIQKTKNAIECGITPIVCLYKKDNDITKDALRSIEDQCAEICKLGKNIIIAYEPQFSIGTGIIPDKEHIIKIFDVIKKASNCLTLYGGSVNEENFTSILDIFDGLLIGGMSLKFDVFYKVLQK